MTRFENESLRLLGILDKLASAEGEELLREAKKRKKKRSQRALHDTTGSFGSVPQSPEHTMSVGASAVSPS